MSEELSKGERTREDIVSAAHELFVEQGYHGTSMRQVAERAGIALGGIYNHFPSKEAIFETVVIEHHPLYRVAPSILKIEGETVEELVRRAAQTMMAQLKGGQTFFNLMFIELVEFKGVHIPQLFEKVFPAVMGFVQRISEAKGNLRDLPPQAIVAPFFGMMFANYLLESLTGPRGGEFFNEENVDNMLEVFLHGILADGPIQERSQ